MPSLTERLDYQMKKTLTYCLYHSGIVNWMVHKRLQLRKLQPVFIPHEIVNDPYLIVNVNS